MLFLKTSLFLRLPVVCTMRLDYVVEFVLQWVLSVLTLQRDVVLTFG